MRTISEAINALPRYLRDYIHDIETRCDPAGDVKTIASLREQRDALLFAVREIVIDRVRAHPSWSPVARRAQKILAALDRIEKLLVSG